MGQCFAYDAAGPRLYVLNTTTWLVLSLCTGRGRDDVASRYYREVEPLLTRQEAGEHVDAALADLLGKQLIQSTEGRIPS